MSKRCYAIDAAKLLFALLVICIHTDPLGSYTDTGNFILTRVFGRLAVPFFFIAAGYFFFVKQRTSDGLFQNLRRLGLIYFMWSGIYFIVNIYKWRTEGFDTTDLFLYVRDFFLVGSYYHLWFLPALMFAIAAVYVMLKRFTIKTVLLLSFVLYGVGLLADSYYGLTIHAGTLHRLIDGYLNIFSYSRNGLFFALPFVAVGAYLARRSIATRPQPTRSQCAAGLMLSLLLLAGEAILLRWLEIPQHDSMYVSLIPCVAFVFLLLIRMDMKERPVLRRLSDWSLLVYLVHPAIILVVRGIAQWIPMLKDDSLVYFLSIATASLIVSHVWLRLSVTRRWVRVLMGGRANGTPKGMG